MGVELKERLEFALTLAAAAEKEILPRFRQTTTRLKPDGSEVTDADLAAEQAVRALLEKHAPQDAVLGEEFGGGSTDGERVWIIDPIDGTQAFALGVPTFGALIGYAERGKPVLGVMTFPALNQIVFAAKGLGCRMRTNGGDAVTLRGTKIETLAEAHVSATSLLGSSTMIDDGLNLGAVVKRARRFRFVGDCLQHALVCAGRLDAAIDLLAAPWDICAVIPCLEEAGCIAADVRGESAGVLTSGSLMSSGAPALMREIATTLRT